MPTAIFPGFFRHSLPGFNLHERVLTDDDAISAHLRVPCQLLLLPNRCAMRRVCGATQRPMSELVQLRQYLGVGGGLNHLF